jgi:hypothetical protein
VTDDSAALNTLITLFPDVVIDGEGREYVLTDTIVLKENTILENFVLRMNDSTKTVVKWGIMESEGTVLYKRGLSLRNIQIKGTYNYGLVISGCTGFRIDTISFEASVAYSAFMYLNRMYDGYVSYLTFAGATSPAANRLDCKCLFLDIGVNGVVMSGIYTSGQVGYGVYIKNSAHITLMSPILQGHAYGLWVEGGGRVAVMNPYFEETVNQIVTSNNAASVRSVTVYNGLFLNHSAGNVFAGQDNGAMIYSVGDATSIDITGTKFSNTSKAIAAVGGSATIILRACHGQGASYVDIRQHCFRISGASIVAGYYIEQIGGLTGSSNGIVTTSRTAAGSNQHMTTYCDSGGNEIKTYWTPPLLGSPQVADSLYIEKVGTIRTGSYVLTTSDDVVRFNTTSGTLIATLPTANMIVGKEFVIKKTAGGNNVSVVTAGGVATIDGATSYTITGVGDVAQFQWDGANYILSSSGAGTVGSGSLIENTTPTDSATITNTTLNAAYPVGTNPVGTRVAYSNLTDATLNVAECTRLNSTNWYINITPYKAS